MKNDILITLLSLLAIVTSCNKDDLNEIDAQKTIVTIDENGKANGNHRFTQISDTRFYVDDIEYTAQNGELVVSGYDKAYFNGDASIISVLKYDGRTLNVVGINNSAFRNCENLTSVKMSEGVTIIGNEAFYECSELKSINIPNSVISIGKYAFRGCANLSSVVIPNSVKNIGDDIFYGCKSLTSLTIECDSISLNRISNSSIQNLVIGRNVKKIIVYGDGLTNLISIIVDEENEYYDSRNKCNALIEKATNTLIMGCNKSFIPEGVNSIGNMAFYGRKDIKYIKIPESVISIGNSAFYRCSGLYEISIPNGITSIGWAAFGECTSLTSANIPNGVTVIRSFAFEKCHNLKEIVIPENLVSIEEYAFRECTSLTKITIPNSVTQINRNAFDYCTNLNTINIGSGLREIGAEAFQYCEKLKDVFCYAVNPPSIWYNNYGTISHAFYNVSSLTAHVPSSCVDVYKNSVGWKEFGNIVSIEE